MAGELVPMRDGRFFTYSHLVRESYWVEGGSVFDAALRGQIDVLTSFCQRGKEWIPSSSWWDLTAPGGLTVMHYAVAANQAGVVDLLLQRMQRPHASDVVGVSPLSLACRYGHYGIARALISAGAMIPQVDKKGNTCLHEAAALGQTQCVEMLLVLVTSVNICPILGHVIWMRNRDNDTCYDIAIRNGQTETAAVILPFVKHTLPNALN